MALNLAIVEAMQWATLTYSSLPKTLVNPLWLYVTYLRLNVTPNYQLAIKAPCSASLSGKSSECHLI